MEDQEEVLETHPSLPGLQGHNVPRTTVFNVPVAPARPRCAGQLVPSVGFA